jgi:hypothetical protein
MNPWITGRIIETMQQEARNRGDEARLGRQATSRPSHQPAIEPEPREPRRTRIGLAVARLGLRIAGPHGEPAATAHAIYATPTIDSTYRSSPWTTCGAPSTSSR